MRVRFSILLIWLIGLVACGPPARQAPELTVAAAADLQFAFTELAQLYEAQTGQHVTLVFGSTGQLAQQIENGADYDLFAAANQQFVTDLANSGHILSDTIALYGRGRLVLVVNRSAGVTATSLRDLTSAQITRVAIANPAHAPYGQAAEQALRSAGLWEQVQPKLVFGDNIRQALQFVQTGDAQVGIVALSVANVPEVTGTLLDEALHQPLNQALGVLTRSSQPQQAREFASLINGPVGRPIMRKYGFSLPGEAPVAQP